MENRKYRSRLKAFLAITLMIAGMGSVYASNPPATKFNQEQKAELDKDFAKKSDFDALQTEFAKYKDLDAAEIKRKLAYIQEKDGKVSLKKDATSESSTDTENNKDKSFLKEWGWWIFGGLALLIIIAVGVYFFVIKNKEEETPNT